MKVKVLKKSYEEFDVELPIYRKHQLESCDIFTAIVETAEGMTDVSVHIDHDGRRLEIEIKRGWQFNPENASDYQLGLGEHSSSKAEFLKALGQALPTLRMIEVLL